MGIVNFKFSIHQLCVICKILDKSPLIIIDATAYWHLLLYCFNTIDQKIFHEKYLEFIFLRIINLEIDAIKESNIYKSELTHVLFCFDNLVSRKFEKWPQCFNRKKNNSNFIEYDLVLLEKIFLDSIFNIPSFYNVKLVEVEYDTDRYVLNLDMSLYAHARKRVHVTGVLGKMPSAQNEQDSNTNGKLLIQKKRQDVDEVITASGISVYTTDTDFLTFFPHSLMASLFITCIKDKKSYLSNSKIVSENWLSYSTKLVKNGIVCKDNLHHAFILAVKMSGMLNKNDYFTMVMFDWDLFYLTCQKIFTLHESLLSAPSSVAQAPMSHSDNNSEPSGSLNVNYSDFFYYYMYIWLQKTFKVDNLDLVKIKSFFANILRTMIITKFNVKLFEQNDFCENKERVANQNIQFTRLLIISDKKNLKHASRQDLTFLLKNFLNIVDNAEFFKSLEKWFKGLLYNVTHVGTSEEGDSMIIGSTIKLLVDELLHTTRVISDEGEPKQKKIKLAPINQSTINDGFDSVEFFTNFAHVLIIYFYRVSLCFFRKDHFKNSESSSCFNMFLFQVFEIFITPIICFVNREKMTKAEISKLVIKSKKIFRDNVNNYLNKC